MKKLSFHLLVFITILSSCKEGNKNNQYSYKDASLPVEQRIADLLGRMTIDEKIKQLDMYWGKEVASYGRS